MKKQALFALSAVAILVMSGCDFKKASPDAGKKSASQKITFPLPNSANIQFDYAFIAKNKGYLADQGIDMDFTENQGSNTTAKLIGSGDYPIGIVDTSTAMIARSKGVPLTMVAVIDKANLSAINCHKEANVSQPQDLYGKKIGVIETTATYQQYLILADKENLDRSKITEVPQTDYGTAFFSNQVDCTLNFIQGIESDAALKNVPVTHLLMKDYGINFYGQGIFANSDFLKQNPDLTKKVVSSMLKGLRYETTDPQDAVETFFKVFPDKAAEHDADVLRFQKYNDFRKILPEGVSPDDGLANPDVLQKQKDFLSGLGFVKDDFDLRFFYSNDYLK